MIKKEQVLQMLYRSRWMMLLSRSHLCKKSHQLLRGQQERIFFYADKYVLFTEKGELEPFKGAMED